MDVCDYLFLSGSLPNSVYVNAHVHTCVHPHTHAHTHVPTHARTHACNYTEIKREIPNVGTGYLLKIK